MNERVATVTGAWERPSVGKGFQNAFVTAYFRFHILPEFDGPTEAARYFGLDTESATGKGRGLIIGIRDGKRGVGRQLEQRIADKRFEGSLDKLNHVAEKYCTTNSAALIQVLQTDGTVKAKDKRHQAMELLFEDGVHDIERLQELAYRSGIELSDEASTLAWVRAIRSKLDLPAKAEPRDVDADEPASTRLPEGRPAPGRRKGKAASK